MKTTRTIITLTTDFGGSSPYVAQMKGVLLSRNTELQIVDITHDIAPHDIYQGAIILHDVCPRFPPHSIHLAVVDPGVGTRREIVYAEIGDRHFVAPNNGLLTYLAMRTPPAVIRAVTNRLYFMPEISTTFHGRDIMAPVAAHLSLGLKPARLGPQLDSLVMLKVDEPVIESQRIIGAVAQIDRFGNVITNIDVRHLAATQPGSEVRIHCRGQDIRGIVSTYGDQLPGVLVALVGSNGRLELAVVQGNASMVLGARPGDKVVVNW